MVARFRPGEGDSDCSTTVVDHSHDEEAGVGPIHAYRFLDPCLCGLGDEGSGNQDRSSEDMARGCHDLPNTILANR